MSAVSLERYLKLLGNVPSARDPQPHEGSPSALQTRPAGWKQESCPALGGGFSSVPGDFISMTSYSSYVENTRKRHLRQISRNEETCRSWAGGLSPRWCVAAAKPARLLGKGEREEQPLPSPG